MAKWLTKLHTESGTGYKALKMNPKAKNLHSQFTSTQLAQRCATLEEALELYAAESEWGSEVLVYCENNNDYSCREFKYDLPAKCIFHSDDENGWEHAKETLERIKNESRN